MSLTRCMASGSARLQRLLHAAELLVEHLAAQQVPDLARTSARASGERQS